MTGAPDPAPHRAQRFPGLRAMARNAAFLMSTGVAAAVLRAAYVVLVARGLGPEGYGILSSMQAFYLMFVFAVTAGLPFYLSRAMASVTGESGNAAARTLAVSLAALALVAGVFLAIGLVAEPDPTALNLYALFAVAVVARGAALWARHLFLAREANQYQLTQTLIFRALELAAVGAALAIGMGVVETALIHVLTWLAEAGVSLWILRRRFGPFGRADLRGVLRTAPVLLGVSLAFAASEWLRMAPLVAYRIGGAEVADAGRFAFAWNAALIVAVLIITTMNAAAPAISRARERTDGKDMVYLDFCLRLAPAVAALGVIAGLAAGQWAITLMGGADYAAAAPAFVLALACIWPLAGNHALDQALFLADRARLIFATNAGAALATAAALAVLAPRLPPAAATALAFAALLALMLGKLVAVNRAAPGAGLGSGTARASLAALGATGLALALTAINLPLAVLAGGLALPLFSLALGVVTRAHIREAWAGLRGGTHDP